MKNIIAYELFESAGRGTLIVVDVQPAYDKFFDTTRYVTFIEESVSKYDKILYLFNGPELGYENEDEIKYWLLENGVSETSVEQIEFFDKGYGWFRYCMDEGYTEEITSLVKWMYQNGKMSLEEMERQDWYDAMDEYPEIEKIKDMVHDDPLYLPEHLFAKLKNTNSTIDIIGGMAMECLKEVEIILMALDKNYNLIKKYVYGA